MSLTIEQTGKIFVQCYKHIRLAVKSCLYVIIMHALLFILDCMQCVLFSKYCEYSMCNALTI